MKVFIAGPRAVRELDENVVKKLDNICKKDYEILVGDASGIDSTVQEYLKSTDYKNVVVYASNGRARNNLNHWNVVDVKVDENIKGFDFYVQKDIQMAKDADAGFMVWNGESKGTFNNILNLLGQQKRVFLYFVNTMTFYLFKTKEEFERFISLNIKLSKSLKKMLETSHKKDFEQVSFLE